MAHRRPHRRPDRARRRLDLIIHTSMLHSSYTFLSTEAETKNRHRGYLSQPHPVEAIDEFVVAEERVVIARVEPAVPREVKLLAPHFNEARIL